MIVLTGAAGFIGSCMAAKLLAEGFGELVLVDDFRRADKQRNFAHRPHSQLLDRDELPVFLETHERRIQAVLHLGARTDTAEQDTALFDRLNVAYSKTLWEACTRYQIPFLYASSAATYGAGEAGFSDDHALLPRLHPLNPYGWSKHTFDLWVLQQTETPFFWVGLKFFNVFGPNEYHKGRMASVVFHAFRQIHQTGELKLFRSHRPDYADGGQLRDFIYVKDLVEVIFHLLQTRKGSAIYNLGTGQARTFSDLGRAVFRAMDRPEAIRFIDIPPDIRSAYQYYTQAEMGKLIAQGFTQPFTRLEDGITDYVRNYLVPDRIW